MRKKPTNFREFTVMLNSTLAIIAALALMHCAHQPKRERQEAQNSYNQPSISAEQTVQAMQTTEATEVPQAAQMNVHSPLYGTKLADSKPPTGAPPEISDEQMQFVLNNASTTPQRSVATIRAPLRTPNDSSIKGQTIVEETPQGSWIRVQAEGLKPKTAYSLSLHDKQDCDAIHQGRSPQNQSTKILASIPPSSTGEAHFSQFFKGLKFSGNNAASQRALVIAENKGSQSAACSVLNK